MFLIEKTFQILFLEFITPFLPTYFSNFEMCSVLMFKSNVYVKQQLIAMLYSCTAQKFWPHFDNEIYSGNVHFM